MVTSINDHHIKSTHNNGALLMGHVGILNMEHKSSMLTRSLRVDDVRMCLSETSTTPSLSCLLVYVPQCMSTKQ